MRNSVIFFTGLVILTISFYYARKTNETPAVAKSEMTDIGMVSPYKSASLQKRQEQTAPAEDSDKTLSTISSNEVENLRQRIPAQEEVKREVQSNPHGAPRAIIHFAEALGPMMEKALANESDAKTLINELQECALNESADVSVRALCVSNAEKLSTPHTQLKWQSDKIRDSVPTNILEMADARKILNQNGVN